MGAQVLRPCGHVCAHKNGSVVDDVIETCAHLQTDERSTGTGLGGRRPQPRNCSVDWEASHDDIIVNLLSPAWCSECGALLVGVLQQAVRCRTCRRMACETCARRQPCLAGSLLSFMAAGVSAEDLPPTMQVLCMDMGLILLLARDRPEAVAYAAEVLWRNPTFLRGLIKLVDGTESASLRSVVARQFGICKKTERELAVQVFVAILQEAELPDSGLEFAMELVALEAEHNIRALAVVKESLKHESACVRAAGVRALAMLAQSTGNCNTVLCAKLRDPEPAVRCAALSVLPQLTVEDRVKLAALATGLQDADASVRRAAVVALPLCGLEVESRSRSAMSNALLDRDAEVREEGWTALRALGEASRANILVNLARSNRLDDRTRRRVVEALKELLLPGTPKAIEVTATALASANWWLRLALCDCFYQHLNASDHDVRRVAVSAVDSLADRTDSKAAAALGAALAGDVAKSAWIAIKKRLNDADPDVNRVWLEELRCSQLNEEIRAEVICLVLRNLMEPNWLIQMAATRALQLKVPVEPREVRATLDVFKEDGDASIRSVALEVLEHFSGEDDSICKALSNKSF